LLRNGRSKSIPISGSAKYFAKIHVEEKGDSNAGVMEAMKEHRILSMKGWE